MAIRELLLKATPGQRKAEYAKAEVDSSGNLVTGSGGGGGGVTDHGALTGLADDDHSQYHTDARGDARYSQLGHTHSIANVTGLQTALDSKSSVVSGTATVTVTVPGRVQHEETVSAPGVTASMKVIPSIAPHLDSDENHEDFLEVVSMAATPGTDQVTFRMVFLTPASGPIKLNYVAV